MNRLKKTLVAVLGIAAAVGLASLITSPWEQPQKSHVIVSSTVQVFDHAEKGVTICPTPAPTRLLGEDQWFWAVRCKHCGEEYKIPRPCTFAPTNEETEHLHTTPEQKAHAIKLLNEWVKESKDVPASLKEAEVRWERAMKKAPKS